jgi:hypothetical protein
MVALLKVVALFTISQGNIETVILPRCDQRAYFAWALLEISWSYMAR